MHEGQLILVAGALLTVALVATLIAGRLRVPSLVLFLAIGMLVGSDVLGWLDFDNYNLSRNVGIIALALIIFEGGLAAGWNEIRPVLGTSISLAGAGTVLTALITGAIATWLFDFTLLEGLLIGSILASTDGAAVFGLMRASTLRARLRRTLEGEAGFNDPIAVLLVIGFIAWIQHPDYGIADMAWLFVRQLGIGAAVGIAVGWLAVEAFRRARLDTPGLYPVASLATAALAFGAADVLHGSGFLAVYLAGLALGGARIPAKRTITSFHHGLAWIAQLAMFLILGLLVDPSGFEDVWLQGTVIALALVFLARPIAALAATALTSFSLRERVVLGWAGLRGAVPVVLATFPVIAGLGESHEFFNIVFFAVLLSTIVQGSTFEPLAKRLRVTASEPALPSPIAETGTIRGLGAEVVEYPIEASDAIVGARVRDLDLPREALVNVIVREDQAIPPRGSTTLRAGDRLHILVRQEAAAQIDSLVDRWQEGPIGQPKRPRRAPEGYAPVFSARRWSDEDGDPAAPDAVAGRLVVDLLRTRRDVPGALVMLEDGTLAITGPQLALGGRDLLSDWVRRRMRGAGDDEERAWWEEVLGALAV